MNAMDKDGGPAFPIPSDGMTAGHNGMSLRDWFAGQALAGIMGNPNLMIALEKLKQDPASCAYDMAEFMINERTKQNVN